MSYYLCRTQRLMRWCNAWTTALKEEGFGVQHAYSMCRLTPKSKLGADMPPYRILGACNPSFAHQALQIEDKPPVLLPCNVIVRDAGDRAD